VKKLQNWRKPIRRTQDNLLVWLLIILTLIMGAAWGWSIASGGLLVILLLILFVGITALLLAWPFLTLCLQVIMLSTAPLLRVYLPIQEVPLYATDIFLLLALVGSIGRDRRIIPAHLPAPVCWGLGGFGLASLISSFNLAITTERFIEVLYPLVRHLLLTVGMFYVATRLIRTPAQQRLIGRLLLIGAAVNALLAVVQNLPGIQALGAEIPLLLYGERSFPYYYSGRFEAIVKGEYQRGFGLFQAATTLSGFLSMVLALCILSGKDIVRQSAARNLLTILLAAGVLATYSRQAILALMALPILILLTVRRAGVSARLISILSCIGIIVVAFNLVDLSFLFFRIEQSTDLQETGMARRIGGHLSFAAYVVERPARILIGNGTGIIDLLDRGFIPVSAEQFLFSGFVSDSYFLMAYNLGILGFLSYLLLFGSIVKQAVRRLREQIIGFSNSLLLGLLSALLVAAVLHLFDNYFAESYQIRGIFWLLMSMTLKAAEETKREVHPAGNIRGYEIKLMDTWRS
jgi:hypothetical protein